MKKCGKTIALYVLICLESEWMWKMLYLGGFKVEMVHYSLAFTSTIKVEVFELNPSLVRQSNSVRSSFVISNIFVNISRPNHGIKNNRYKKEI